jgi:uncharacterized MAPEG superfamily protein
MLSYKLFLKIYQLIAPQLAHVPVIFNAKGSLVAMYFLVYATKYLQMGLSLKLLGGYDLRNGSYRYTGPKMDATWQEQLVQRTYHAHLNHWEAFIQFGVATLVALLSGKETHELTVLTNSFLLLRVLFTILSLLSVNTPVAVVRHAVLWGQMAVIARIFSLAVPDLYSKKA